MAVSKIWRVVEPCSRSTSRCSLRSARSIWRRARPGMAFGDEGDQPVMAQRLGEEAWIAANIGQHRHVELVLQQVMSELG